MELTAITTASWPLFEELFGPGGVQGGCWCSYFRLHAKDFSRLGAAGRHEIVHDAVRRDEPFGLVAVDDGTPVGWVSVSPRSCFARLERSTVARPEPGHDLSGTWSVVCFYVPRDSRGRGLGSQLLTGAVDYARQHGATQVEGYPVDPGDGRMAPDELYFGTVAMFLAAGFELVERRGVRRALVRTRIGADPSRC